jgi:crotonobetainyl-CoA:carnitine CoA-transferase CaiB-like acyl-CoA transferase
VALLDAIMPLMGWVAANLLIGGQQPELLGNDNFTAAPSGTFATADGYINIAANKQEQWEAVADELGVAELKTDPRFQKRDARKKNRKALTPLLEVKLREHATEVWVERLNAKGVPSGAILDLRAALDQPQVRHRGTLATVPAEGIGELRLFNLTARFEKTPGKVESAPPRLGQHTDEILGGIGYAPARIAELKQKGIV